MPIKQPNNNNPFSLPCLSPFQSLFLSFTLFLILSVYSSGLWCCLLELLHVLFRSDFLLFFYMYVWMFLFVLFFIIKNDFFFDLVWTQLVSISSRFIILIIRWWWWLISVLQVLCSYLFMSDLDLFNPNKHVWNSDFEVCFHDC